MANNDELNRMFVTLLYNVISSSIIIVMIINIITSSSNVIISTPSNVSIIITPISVSRDGRSAKQSTL